MNVKLLTRKARCGNMEAQYQLGCHFFENKKYAKAFKWFEKAAELGVADAVYMLGNCYMNGYGVKSNWPKGAEYMIKAANLKVPAAICCMAGLYQGREDYFEKIHNFKMNVFESYMEAANLGYTDAMFIVAQKLGLGDGVETNETESLKWYMKAAENNHPYAQLYVGIHLYEKMQYTKSLHWFKLSAEQGNCCGNYYIGEQCFNGYGVNKDVEKAFDCFMKAANDDCPHGQYRVGYCYDNGIVVNENKELAFEYYLKSAKQWMLVESHLAVGLCYKDRIGTAVNMDEAFLWLRNAALLGSSIAQYEIGYMYFNGLGTEVNHSKSLKWYQRSFENGNKMACKSLGFIYENGDLTIQNYQEAIKWYKVAVDSLAVERVMKKNIITTF